MPAEDRAPSPSPSGWQVLRTAAARALRRRCPQCGAGELFAGRMRLRQECERCGLVYRREQGAMTGSMYLSAVVTELFAALFVVLVFFATDWGAAHSIAVGVPIVVAFSYWFLPRSRALWVAVEYATDAANGEPWARPR